MKKLFSLTLAILMTLMLISCDASFLASLSGLTGNAPDRGSFTDNAYTNEFLGFTFNKPDSWSYSTDEEIAALLNLSVDKILGENFKEALKNNPSIYDMMAVEAQTGANVSVVYENLLLSLSMNITVEQYITAVKAQLNSTAGMSVVFPDTYDTVKLGQTEFTRVCCVTTLSGISMQQNYYLHKKDGYMCSVIVTIPTGYTTAEIEAMFS